jgi:hypothetical protein
MKYMRRINGSVFTLLILLGLTQCHNERQKIKGVWQLQTMVVNGTTIPGTSLGMWLWEFNQSGGYLTDVAGMREKGLYTLTGDQLTLKHAPAKKLPDQVYKVIKLDTAELDLQPTDQGSSTNLHFIKRKTTEVPGADND